MSVYYVYFHFRKDTGEVFYIGKGKDKRAYRMDHRSNYWNNIVNKYGYSLSIIKDNLTEKEAFDLEKYYIKMFKHSLVNICEGGQGGTRKWSDGSRLKMSKSMQGNKNGLGNKGNVGNTNRKGVKILEETKNKISDTLKEYVMTDIHKENVSIGVKKWWDNKKLLNI